MKQILTFTVILITWFVGKFADTFETSVAPHGVVLVRLFAVE